MEERFLGVVQNETKSLPSHSEILKNRVLSTLFFVEDMTGVPLANSEKGRKIRKHVLSVANDIGRISKDKDLI